MLATKRGPVAAAADAAGGGGGGAAAAAEYPATVTSDANAGGSSVSALASLVVPPWHLKLSLYALSAIDTPDGVRSVRSHVCTIGPRRCAPSQPVVRFELPNGGLRARGDLQLSLVSAAGLLAADDELVLAASLVGTAVRASTLMLGYAGAGGATSIADVPLPLLDDRALPVGKLLNTVGTPGAADAAGGGGSSTDGASRTPRWRTTYMDDELRVSRDALEHFFIFVRAPSDVEQ